MSDIQRVQSTDPKAANYDPTGQYTGRPVVDATGYPLLDPTLKYAGTTQPKYRFGLTNTFKFKGITLAAVVEYRGGRLSTMHLVMRSNLRELVSDRSMQVVRTLYFRTR
ncbi:hypothetical protein [Spirosoma telluris]|uniref:hypothetical protein n=1 Tax=Spirosoma telluris TaxID=2183553 RepID=UPI002FC2D49F